MTSPVAPIQNASLAEIAGAAGAVPRAPAAAYGAFSTMLMQGIERVNETSAKADAMVTAFALDDSIPPHQVMFALQQSHAALAMLLQVRSRLTEGFQEIMRLQL